MGSGSNLPQSSLIGEWFEITPVEQTGGNERHHFFRCEPHQAVPDDWSITLSVPSDESVTHHQPVEGWVFRLDRNRNEMVVTTDSFGRADLHSLESRHLEAADHVATLVLHQEDDPGAVNNEKISHAKGMLTRCLKKDQWDWYTVYSLLGRPPLGQVNRGRRGLIELRDAVDSGDSRGVTSGIETLQDTGITSRFAYFIRNFNLGKEFELIDSEYLMEQLHALTPEEFEHFIADCWSQNGWETRVTTEHEDIGVDVIASQSEVVPRKHLIQAKRRDPSRNIGVADVQRYAGIGQEYGADEVYLVTTGQFSGNAWRWAENSPVKLMDGEALTRFIRLNELGPVVAQYRPDIAG